MTYLVQHSRPMRGGPERYEEFPDAAQAAWRLAMRAGAAVVVDEQQPSVPVGRTRRWENGLQPHEPVIVFDDLRPDAAVKAHRALLRFLERVGRYPFPPVTQQRQVRFSPSRGAVPRAEERERFAAPIRAAWAEL